MITIQEVQKDPQLFDLFMHENEGLIWSILKRNFAFTYGTGESEDYFQEGCVGMIKAVKNFNPEMNVAFSTYAVPVIKGSMARHRRDYGSTILKVSRNVKTLHFKISSLKAKGMTVEEICNTLNITEDEYNSSAGSLFCESLNGQIGDGDDRTFTREDTLSSDIDVAEQVVEKEYLRDKLRRLKEILTEKQYSAFIYYLNGMSQAEIGKRIGVTQVQISRMLKNIIDKCKKVGEERKVVEMKPKITMVQLLHDCEIHGTNRNAAILIAEQYNMAPSSVYALINKHKIRRLLESAKTNIKPDLVVKEEKPAFVEKPSLSLLKIDVMAGQEFKYELGEELKIIKGDGNLICNDLSRLIQELQEIQQMRQVG